MCLAKQNHLSESFVICRLHDKISFVGMGRKEDSRSWSSNAWSNRSIEIQSRDHSWRLWHWCRQV